MRDAGLPYPRSGCYHCKNGGLMGCPYEKPQAVEVVVETPSPQPGQPWVHRNGKKYTVLLLTNLDSDRTEYTPQVVYQGDNGKIWSRALSDWHRSFNPQKAEVTSGVVTVAPGDELDQTVTFDFDGYKMSILLDGAVVVSQGTRLVLTTTVPVITSRISHLEFAPLSKRVDKAIAGIHDGIFVSGDLVGLLRDLQNALLIETAVKDARQRVRDWRTVNPT